MHTVYLSLGTNLGWRKRNLRRAIRLIAERIGAVERSSSVVETEPWGFVSTRKFLNSCIAVSTDLEPRELLQRCQQIERDMGRTHKTTHGEYQDRIIDIDILLYDNLRIDEPDLQIPHPLMWERSFVMIPLKEIYNEKSLHSI